MIQKSSLIIIIIRLCNYIQPNHLLIKQPCHTSQLNVPRGTYFNHVYTPVKPISNRATHSIASNFNLNSARVPSIITPQCIDCFSTRPGGIFFLFCFFNSRKLPPVDGISIPGNAHMDYPSMAAGKKGHAIIYLKTRY